MNYAVIKAGGTGVRLQPSDRPKQFIEVLGKPIIVYTIEKFQQSDLIDEIVVVCLAGWEEHMRSLAEKYSLTKVKRIVTGGENGHISVKNGVLALDGVASEGDIIVVQDAVRPEFTENTLKSSVDVAKEYGAAVVCAHCLESMFFSERGEMLDKHQPPYKIYRAQAPQAYEYATMVDAYEKAKQSGEEDCISTDQLYMKLSIPIKAVINGQQNFKITTIEDVYTFTAMCYYRQFVEGKGN